MASLTHSTQAANERCRILNRIGMTEQHSVMLEMFRKFCLPDQARDSARKLIDIVTRSALDELDDFLPSPDVIVPISRAGMAMWSAADEHFDHPESVFAIGRKEKGTSHVTVTLSTGVRTTTRDVLLLDTVSATGDTIVRAATTICAELDRRAQVDVLMCYASPEALHRIENSSSIGRIAVAIQATGVTPDGWLLPLINGDAGDKLYGSCA